MHDRDVETAFLFTALPHWQGDQLVGIDKNHTSGPILYTIGRDGRRDETLFTFAGAGLMHLGDIALSRTGEIAIIGSATTSAPWTTFLARISPDRRQQTVTRVWPYCPMVVTFAEDGTIWTIGHLKNEENTAVVAYDVPRRFDRAGTVVGTTKVSRIQRRTQETSHLRSSRDRVGWLTRDNEYREFSLDGNQIGFYELEAGDREVTGVAMSDANDVIVGRFRHGKTEFLALDRAAHDWRPLSLSKEYSSGFWFVNGFDGPNLVTNQKNGTLTWMKPAE